VDRVVGLPERVPAEADPNPASLPAFFPSAAAWAHSARLQVLDAARHRLVEPV
jgi:hypothetical protein